MHTVAAIGIDQAPGPRQYIYTPCMEDADVHE
jgi:hypothetical protein